MSPEVSLLESENKSFKRGPTNLNQFELLNVLSVCFKVLTSVLAAIQTANSSGSFLKIRQ